MKAETILKFFSIQDYVRITYLDGRVVKGKIIEIGDETVALQSKIGVHLISVSNLLLIEKQGITESTLSTSIPVKGPAVESNKVHVPKLTNEKAKIIDTPITSNAEQQKPAIKAAVSFNSFTVEDIPWKEDGLPEEELFKGRDELINRLIKHYTSIERKKTYMLYGLTRTGKSSILRYFDAKILNLPIRLTDKHYKFIPFIWDLSRAANQSSAKDLWYYLLGNCTAHKIKKLLLEENSIDIADADLIHQQEFRAKHFREIITYLKINGYFPIFLIDEFTYYENLVKREIIDSSFLQTLRQLAFDNFACFVYAGAYNLKKMKLNKEYGLTGQFVNVIEETVLQIKREPAIELIKVFNKIKFTEQAVDNILKLSNFIPYFIQIICKNVGFFCAENRINNVNEEILEYVVQILVGDMPTPKDTMIRRISAGTFDNNQYSPLDSVGTIPLLSTIAYLEKDNKIGNGIKFNEILRFWNDNHINSNLTVKEAIEDLTDKKILTLLQESDSIPRYKIGVDLFRRWLHNEKPDIELELSKLQNA